ncbi:VOC family protein [Viridibacillus sp. NPDC093762]|uniref:VOC family protein n=1 Tax=Viridibacillus sp. NPDC093762 TaxID=3390720 RepID=UPI003D051F64
MTKVTPFLMFQGNAEEAMNYYVALIPDSKVLHITRYGANGTGTEGSVMKAAFSLKGQEILCIDSNVQHDFTFTPSFSLYITCDSEKEIDDLYGKLSDGGSELMPLDNYGFSKKFGWLVDQFGVSWQLTFE